MKSACAVIPAAGRGSRLGMDCPKLLVPINGERTIWSILRDLLMPVADRVHVVLSPGGHPQFLSVLASDLQRDRISASIQETPTGMGDAIFSAASFWNGFDRIVVVWGDQVNLSPCTVMRVSNLPLAGREICLPLTRQQRPYVQYDFIGDQLTGVRQSREGDVTDANGYSDVGLFALSTAGLRDEWERYIALGGNGAQTGEVNFLPFLVYLSRDRGWRTKCFVVDDPDEARGVNTAEDLAFARMRLNVPFAIGTSRDTRL